MPLITGNFNGYSHMSQWLMTTYLFPYFHWLDCRISGDTAKELDIYQSVCEQMERNFAKSRWKVGAAGTRILLHKNPDVSEKKEENNYHKLIRGSIVWFLAPPVCISNCTRYWIPNLISVCEWCLIQKQCMNLCVKGGIQLISIYLYSAKS